MYSQLVAWREERAALRLQHNRIKREGRAGKTAGRNLPWACFSFFFGPGTRPLTRDAKNFPARAMGWGAFLCVLTAPYHLTSLHPSRKTSRAIHPAVLFLWDPISRGRTTSVQPRFPVELTPTTRCNIRLMKTQWMDLLGLPPNSPLVTQFLPHKVLKEAVFPRVAQRLRADTSLAPPRAVTQSVNQTL